MDIDKIRNSLRALRFVIHDGDDLTTDQVAGLISDADAALAELDTAPAAPIFLAVYIGTTNDRGGNPRRGWYVSRLDGAPVVGDATTAWIEEDYDGDDALYRAVASAVGLDLGNATVWAVRDHARRYVRETGRIDVTPGEYRDARKLPRFGGAE